MGNNNTFSSPITHIAQQSLQASCSIIAGAACMQNRRNDMEDYVRIAKLNNNRYLFAVFDGHSGKETAQYLFHHVVEVFRDVKWNDDVLIGICQKLNGDIESKAGSTAVIALLEKTDDTWDVTCLHVGDSRLIKSSKEKVVFSTLDHNAQDEKEVKRVVDAGGEIIKGRLSLGNTQLAMTRAFGHDKTKKNLGLIAEPSIARFKCESGDVLYLFSDGLLEQCLQKTVTTQNEIILKITAHLLQEKDAKTLTHECGKLLRSVALDESIVDNLSLIVVHFGQWDIHDEIHQEVLEGVPSKNVDDDYEYAEAFWMNFHQFNQNYKDEKKEKKTKKKAKKRKTDRHLSLKPEWQVPFTRDFKTFGFVMDRTNPNQVPLVICRGAWKGNLTEEAILTYDIKEKKWVRFFEDVKGQPLGNCLDSSPTILCPNGEYPTWRFHCRANDVTHQYFLWEDRKVVGLPFAPSIHSNSLRQFKENAFPEVKLILYENKWIIDRSDHNRFIPLQWNSHFSTVSCNSQWAFQIEEVQEKDCFVLRRFSFQPLDTNNVQSCAYFATHEWIETICANQDGTILWMVVRIRNIPYLRCIVLKE